ncbi:MAG TPA: lipid-binding SYLF domain-containing protein [Pyrinomonadaceae bacterium]|nr:lipid-binding SYLF domain-containing protein [Pyrinomonadaceae bacterium]
MKRKTLLKSLLSFLAGILISFFPAQASYGQTNLDTAVRRSQNSAKTIKLITELPEDESIPKEFFQRAQAIAVFPDVVRLNMLFSQGMKGYGVVCSRLSDGWSLPSYYRFGSSHFSLKIAGAKSFDLVILFMSKSTPDWFQEGRFLFKDLRAGVAGPVGKLTRQADLDMSGVGVIMYMLVDGKLKGMDIDSDFLDGAYIDPDNNINKPIYGVKGREVLQGKDVKAPPTTPSLTAFRDILTEKFPVSK